MGPHQTSQVLARPRRTSRYIAGLRPTSQDLARRRRTSPILLVNSMEFCLSSMAIPWNFFKFHGILLQFKKDLVNMIKFHGILVNSMEFCSVPWAFHGILFKFHGTCCSSMAHPWAGHGSPMGNPWGPMEWPWIGHGIRNY